LFADTAYCRSPVASRWYKYDDHEVMEISSSDIKVRLTRYKVFCLFSCLLSLTGYYIVLSYDDVKH